MTTQQDKAAAFRALHTPGSPLALANAWDVASARVVEAAGAPAVATTSAGVAWGLGAPDGDKLDRDSAIDLIARIAAAVEVPVTADIESGFAETADGVGDTIGKVIEAGAVGVNLEDGWHGGSAPQRTIDDASARIAAARAAADASGVALFVNARVDNFLRRQGDPSSWLPDVLARAKSYVDAGADGVFVPGVVDLETARALVDGIDAPVNVLAWPGAPTVPEFAEAGVARVSVGSWIAQAAYAVAARAAEELHSTGGYGPLADATDYGTLNSLFGR
ncbi:2-methylisocitrate lyase-like PEP mutase family enzyme [Herbihabitans rhizosphaerae]|uniref:2-methylisocitrate lyase-like PEP mutase family enzyme n=1 Tax=Herbihabitans rhizosphaerae TaxID=1872711 RepID=A0A4Q7KJE1_9PSEU|nr:isocitrate lyase/phosphoenolpyruvate mutase family protein [Herbihabitans rhizosphaerae]RZS36535.1 2-methylisocitrate lyase-like PEP mutase family enzyme [Herbihabitans rhizosphaerae]